MDAGAPWLVLDTNAWLDLLVFDDPALEGIDEAIRRGRVQVAVDARAIEELARILRTAKLALDPEAADECLQRATRLSTMVAVSASSLPRCRDPDDQMFLEIAASVRARWLLTRDAELLRMSRRMTRDYGVEVLTPVSWRGAYLPQMSNR